VLRVFDIILSATGLVAASPLLALLLIVGLFDTGSPLFRQMRLGQWKKPFTLVKFRTMRLDTKQVATHLADVAAVTPFGRFLRRTKLDELPQLWNVLKGEMSLVGPRPCLLNQEELIEARERLGVFVARPGITGLAQVNEIDMSTPQLLAETDACMLASLGLKDYAIYIFMTVVGKGSGDRVNNNQV
jgi:O-antigen biosynthesis protein WbqP